MVVIGAFIDIKMNGPVVAIVAKIKRMWNVFACFRSTVSGDVMQGFNPNKPLNGRI